MHRRRATEERGAGTAAAPSRGYNDKYRKKGSVCSPLNKALSIILLFILYSSLSELLSGGAPPDAPPDDANRKLRSVEKKEEKDKSTNVNNVPQKTKDKTASVNNAPPQTQEKISGLSGGFKMVDLSDPDNMENFLHPKYKKGHVKYEKAKVGIGPTTLEYVRTLTMGRPNQAWRRSASQSSIGMHGEAKRAVDNDLNQDWKGKSITHTKEGDKICNPWWQVDLKYEFEVENVIIYNRLDMFSARLRNFNVDVLKKNKDGGWDLDATLFHKDIAGPITLATFPTGTVGQLVRVKFSHCEPLSLAEVEVYADGI